jgi:hypothetical protein
MHPRLAYTRQVFAGSRIEALSEASLHDVGRREQCYLGRAQAKEKRRYAY